MGHFHKNFFDANWYSFCYNKDQMLFKTNLGASLDCDLCHRKYVFYLGIIYGTYGISENRISRGRSCGQNLAVWNSLGLENNNLRKSLNHELTEQIS